MVSCDFPIESALELAMTVETARKVSSNPEVLKRFAKYLAQQCFRNTMLEDLHAGIIPDSVTGGYSDVAVRSPMSSGIGDGIPPLSQLIVRLLFWFCFGLTACPTPITVWVVCLSAMCVDLSSVWFSRCQVLHRAGVFAGKRFVQCGEPRARRRETTCSNCSSGPKAILYQPP
jgi:hypothetical protein